MTAAELTARLGHVEEGTRDNWGWNWNVVKRVLEHLFEEGIVSAASRTGSFERRYTLTGRVLPKRDRDGERDGERGRRPQRWTGWSTPPRRPTESGRSGASRTTSGFRCAPPRCPCSGSSWPAGFSPWPSRAGRKPLYRHVGAKLPARCDGPGPAEPVRLPGFRTPPAAGAVRVPLPDRDLHPATTAAVRLLRAPVPAAGRDRGAGGPQSGPGRPAASGAGRLRRTRRAAATPPSNLPPSSS